MKNINRIELQGHVGDVRSLTGKDTSGITFGLATNLYYRDDKSETGFSSDVTWHNVTAWEGNGICSLSKVKKGVPVHVIGRLRRRDYEINGERRVNWDVIACVMDVLEADEKPQSDRPRNEGMRATEETARVASMANVDPEDIF